MKYLKKFELFGFKMTGKKKSWKEKFEDIYNWYLKNKNKKDISILDLPSADVKKDEMSISKWDGSGFDNHIVFYGETTSGNCHMEVIDFSEADYSDPKSKKGVYPITKSEYDEYEKKIQEISDWLDDRSEKEFGKSGSKISDDGEVFLDFDESDIALEEINDKIKKEFDFIGKKYEFEMSYHLWTSTSTNKLIVERKELPITDIEIGFGGGRFYCQLFTLDPFGEKAEIWLESDSSSEYYDFDNNKWPYDKENIIRMSSIKKDMNRRDKREFDRNRKYPYAFSYDITPCKWESIEMVKNITSLLEQMNDVIKNKK